ncbi:MAG: hypothetical protein ACRC8S_16950 [Fimbriiglobus sp.]
MSQDHPAARIEELRQAARGLPWSYTRAALLEEATQIADSCQDVPLGYEIRLELIDAARYSLRYDLYAATFAWCFAVATKEPERYSISHLLEYYQYVIGNLANFPHVSKEQFLALHADAAKHFKSCGFSLRTLTIERGSAAIDYADRQLALEAYAEIPKHPRDQLTMSREMEKVREVEHYNFLNDDAGVSRAYDQFMGDETRGRWADLWFTNLVMRSLYRFGRKTDAEVIYQRNQRQFPTGSGYGWSWGHLISFSAITGRENQGIRHLREQLPVALSHSDRMTHFYCLSHAAVLLDRLVEQQAGLLALPKIPGTPWSEPEIESALSVEMIREWLLQQLSEITTLFDTRNGNTYFAELVAARRADPLI